MVESYDLIFLVITYIIAIISVIIFILSALFIIIEFCIYKKNTYKAITYTFLGISIIGIYLTLPWCFLGLATNTNSSKAESYYKMAVNTALLPTVKSYMLYHMGTYNETISKDGNKAIENYEKSISYSDSQYCNINNYKQNGKCKDYIFSGLISLCNLYTIKGNTEKGIKICNQVGLKNMIVMNYILNNDYTNALIKINESIKQIETLKTSNGLNYAIRANIYEQLGEKQKAQKDFEKAQKISNDERIQKVKSNKNYYKDFYNKKRIEYKF